jgi:glyoxylase-like metal-dependent hydrolase (beta-lactamase superfamily II)
MLQAQFPDKPIRFVAVTHFHYDHTGGVRGLASYGASALVERARVGDAPGVGDAA